MESKPKEEPINKNNLNDNKKKEILESCSGLAPLKFVKKTELIILF